MTDKDKLEMIDEETAQHLADGIFGQPFIEVPVVRRDGTVGIPVLTPSYTWTDGEWAEFDMKRDGEA